MVRVNGAVKVVRDSGEDNKEVRDNGEVTSREVGDRYSKLNYMIININNNDNEAGIRPGGDKAIVIKIYQFAADRFQEKRS